MNTFESLKGQSEGWSLNTSYLETFEDGTKDAVLCNMFKGCFFIDDLERCCETHTWTLSHKVTKDSCFKKFVSCLLKDVQQMHSLFTHFL